VNIDKETVRKILTEDLDMKKVCAKMVPKELTEEQKQRRVLMQNTSMVSLDGGSACKVDDVTALPCHIQDGGYTLLWQRYDNNKMAAICYSTSSTVQS